MKISKIREVTTPRRGKSVENDRSAGLDFFIPLKTVEFVKDLLSSNDGKIIPVFGDRKEFNRINQSYFGDRLRESVDEASIAYLSAFEILPHQNIIIPSGIKANIQTVKGFDFGKHNGLMFEAANKSSISRFKHLDVGATIVDEDYQGEIHISLTNTHNSNIILHFNEKIAQFILVPIILDDVDVVDESELYSKTSTRGEGCFGSTIDND